MEQMEHDLLAFEVGAFWIHNKNGHFVFISAVDFVRGKITLTDTEKFASIEMSPGQVRGIYSEHDDAPPLTADQVDAIGEFLEYLSTRKRDPEDYPPKSKHFRPVGVRQFYSRTKKDGARNNFGRLKDVRTE